MPSKRSALSDEVGLDSGGHASIACESQRLLSNCCCVMLLFLDAALNVEDNLQRTYDLLFRGG